MGIEKNSLRETPVITAQLITGDAVSVDIFLKDGTPVALDSNTATENVAGSGKYDYELDFTNKPGSGKNYYDIRFNGSLQTVWKSFSWDEEISEFNGHVCIDTVSGTDGQGFPIGCEDTPSKNLADGKAIADRNKFNQFCLKSNLTLDRALPGYKFIGQGQATAIVITLNNQNIDGASFDSVSMTGQCNGNIFTNLAFLNSVTDFSGTLQNTAINTSISVKVGGVMNGFSVFGNSTTGVAPVLDCQNSPFSLIGLADFTGLLEIRNFVNGVILIGGNTILTLAGSCVGGMILVSGHKGYLEDLSGPGCTVWDLRDAGLSEQTATKAVVDAMNAIISLMPGSIWDSVASSHRTAGSMGEIMRFLMAHVGGRLHINDETFQAELYDPDNTTLIATFDLKDFNNLSAIRNLADRLRAS